jgi:predicted flap endonuclease-1-like 5' DNA nuclease
MLLVLNQQLEAARTHNDQLLAEVRNLEARLRQQGRGDDLTRIHGVGQKLAEQLNELGIFHFQQIAELEVAALGEEGHALYAHRSRILRDAWIDQAGRLARH